MAQQTMRRVREGEVPRGGGTAVQEDAARPVFRGNGADDYVCVDCGNVLAVSMDPVYMDFKDVKEFMSELKDLLKTKETPPVRGRAT